MHRLPMLCDYFLEGEWVHSSLFSPLLRGSWFSTAKTSNYHLCPTLLKLLYLIKPSLYKCTREASGVWIIARNTVAGERCGYDSLVAQLVKNPPAMRGNWIPSLGWEDPLKEGMATHSSLLAWRKPMDREAWQAAVHGVIKSWLGLDDYVRACVHTHTHTHTHTLWERSPPIKLINTSITSCIYLFFFFFECII